MPWTVTVTCAVSLNGHTIQLHSCILSLTASMVCPGEQRVCGHAGK